MFFLILLTTLLCIIVTLLVKYISHKRRLLKYVSHLPTAKGYPFIGSAYQFLGKNTKGVYNTLLEITRMPNSTVAWLGTMLFIVLHEPEDVQSVLLSPNCLDKPYIYRFFPFKFGLFTSEAHMWKSNRKLLSPSFNLKILMGYIPTFNETSKLLVNQLKQKIHDKNFDLSKHIFACILDTTSATVMGFDSDIQKGKNKEFLEGMKRLFQIVTNRMMKFWLHPSFIYKLTGLHQTEKHLYDHVLRVANMVKTQRQNQSLKKHNEKTNNNPSEDKFSETTPLFLDSLLKLANDGKITDDQVIDNEITLMYGGTETTALMVSHTILMLAMHPQYQDRVFDELKCFCNSADETVNYETISKLQYLEMVIKETMRLFPIAPILGRNCSADTKISSCTIPKGSIVAIVVDHLHRKANIWGLDADNFNPDHFLPDQIAGRHTYSYLPFSGGQRNCIGIKYGWMLMKVVLTHLLLNFKFSTDLKMTEISILWHGVQKLNNMDSVKMERRG